MINIKLAKNSNIPNLRTKDGIYWYAVYIENKYQELTENYNKLIEVNKELEEQRVHNWHTIQHLRSVVSAYREKIPDKILKASRLVPKLRGRIRKAKDQYLKIFLSGVSYSTQCQKTGHTILVNLDKAEEEIKKTLNEQ